MNKFETLSKMNVVIPNSDSDEKVLAVLIQYELIKLIGPGFHMDTEARDYHSEWSNEQCTIIDDSRNIVLNVLSDSSPHDISLLYIQIFDPETHKKLKKYK